MCSIACELPIFPCRYRSRAGTGRRNPPEITFAEADAPLLTPVVELAKPAEPEPQPPVIVNEPEVTPPLAQEKPARRLPLWSLPVAAVIIAAIVGPLLWKQQTTQPVPAAAAVEVAKIDMAPLPALASALPCIVLK